MNIGELYLALQQGTVDGQENPLGNIKAFSWHEVQKYLSLSSHVYTPVTLVMNGQRWDSLSDEQKAAVERAAAKAVEHSRQFGADNDATLLDELSKTHGGQRDRSGGLPGGFQADLGRDRPDRGRGVHPGGDRRDQVVTRPPEGADQRRSAAERASARRSARPPAGSSSRIRIGACRSPIASSTARSSLWA